MWIPIRVAGRAVLTVVLTAGVAGAASLRPARYGRSSELAVGDVVLAMGSPLGLTSSVTDGIVSAVGRTVPEPASDNSPSTVLRQTVQTSAPINPGNSGGALVNLNGEVVGIPTLAAIEPEFGGPAPGIGFLRFPQRRHRRPGRQIVVTGRVVDSHRTSLGVTVQTVTEPDGTLAGAGIVAVDPGGPAARAGFQPGDVITAVDGTPVPDAVPLQMVLAQHKPGDKVAVTVLQDGAASTVQVVLGELLPR